MLDPVTVKILWDRLVSIVDEATVAQYRTAFSTVVQEANDFACSIMDTTGGTLANSQTGLPSFVATQAFTLSAFLRRFPSDEFHPGDVFITNDPWIGTGQAMDITLLSPIFRGERLVAFAGSVAHAPDLGGAQHWNLSVDVFAEALLIPPLKLYDRGQPNETLLALIRANSRLPQLTLGDLDSQLAAIHRSTTRLLSVMEEYELPDLEELIAEIYTRSEGAMRAAVAAIPDGAYVGEVWSEGFRDPADERANASEPEPILIRATVTVAGSDLTVDFAGSSSQVPGSFNSVWTFTTAYSLYALRYVLVPFFPNNAGFYRPLRVVCPEGTVVNARYPAATLSRHVIGHQVADAIYAALAPVLPDAVLAQGGSAPSWDLLLTGQDARGRHFHRLVIINGGMGAGPREDGATLCFPANISNTPVEILESAMPIICEEKEIIAGSAGEGRTRGGFGQRMTFRALAPVQFSLINARVRHAPQGLLGGGPGRAGRAVAAGRELPPGSNGSLAPGETLVIETPGGGGLGLVSGRDAGRIERDRRDGIGVQYESET
jgi:N-methylhydantoinase B